ncbi:MAG: hypothetical protein V4472_24860 [Pseudomonadota bacterium]
MIYLTGATNDQDEPRLIAGGVGLMVVRGNSYHLRIGRYPFWAADIGMAASDADPYLAWLDHLSTRDRCLFAVSPDAYPDAIESQRRGLEFAPLIREMGYPAAVVAQDGAERLAWPWEDMDCLFVGGERRSRCEWKVSPAAERLVRAARNAGKWVHMGRVNSLRRLERARSMGVNSVDGTFVKYWRRKRAGEDSHNRGGAELARWTAVLDAERTLPGFTDFETPSLPVHREAALVRVGGGDDTDA